MDKQLLEIYQDFDLIELLWLAEHPEDIETACPLCCDDCVSEHLGAIKGF